MRCCLLLLLLSNLSAQVSFKKLFTDAGVAIHCPSDNKVYIHPISGDLQQCSQQLGNYNESSCPEGTVCERFPILIPGFQDYCCWADSQTTDTENLIIGSTTEIPDELLAFTEPPSIPPMRKLVVTAAPERPEEETNNSEEEDYEEPTTKRPRNRKTTTTTTTEKPTTTTKKPSNRRLPRCQNQDDMPLIDFGNRLRDCYYYRCNPGYKCEPNKEIRKLICCGAATFVDPPGGLPIIPQPKPLMPRPIRRGPFNFNDGDENEEGNGCPYDKQNGCKMVKGNQHGNNINQNSQNNQNINNWNENGCPYGTKTTNGCPFGSTNRPLTNGIQDGCSGNTIQGSNSMQGCGMKNGWSQNGMNGNNVEQQQLPPPRSIPEPQPLQLSGGANGPQGQNGNWGDYDNPYELNNQENRGNYNKKGSNGQENSQVQRPQSQGNNGSGGSWNTGSDGNWQGSNGYNNNLGESNSGNWQGSSTNRPNGNGWNEGYSGALSSRGGNTNNQENSGNWNGSPSSRENNWENSQGNSWNGRSGNQENNWESQNNNNWNRSPSPQGNNKKNSQGNSWNGRSGNQENAWESQNANSWGKSNGSPNDQNKWNNRNGNINQNGDWKQQGNWGNNGMNNGVISKGQSRQVNGNNQHERIPNQMGSMNGMGNDYNDYDNFQERNWGNENGISAGQPKPLANSWNNGNYGSNKRSMSNSRNKESCPAGSEFRVQGAAPKCSPPGSDSCPLSYPKCIPSSSLGHNVCCL